MDLGQKPEIIVKIEIKADREAKREDGGKCMWPWCGGASSAVRSRDPRPGIRVQVGVVGKMHGPWDA